MLSSEDGESDTTRYVVSFFADTSDDVREFEHT